MLRILSLAVITLVVAPGRAPVRAPSRPEAARCDVRGIYKAIDTPAGTIGLTSLGDAAELEQVLVPTKLDDGTYEVTVSRKGDDLYRVDGTSTYLVTQYCYEYVYLQKAILRYSSLGSIGNGSLIFEP